MWYRIKCETMSTIFHSLCFLLIRPRPYPTKGYENTEEGKTKKRVEAEVDNTIILVYPDEGYFQIQATITRG